MTNIRPFSEPMERTDGAWVPDGTTGEYRDTLFFPLFTLEPAQNWNVICPIGSLLSPHMTHPQRQCKHLRALLCRTLCYVMMNAPGYIMMEILGWKQGQIWESTDVGPGMAFDVKQLWGIGQVILPLWATVFICKMTGLHWRNSN